jgi:hypothetical protein
LLTVGAACLVAVNLAVLLWNAVYAKWLLKREKNRIRKHLLTLTEDEQEIIGMYVRQKTRSMYLHPNDGVVEGLELAGVIYQTTIHGTLSKGFAYNLTPIAWELLDEVER